ncbi:MAG: hypothetical protein IJ583_05735 [Firmicutes bacterium]|nr:hypothetical protein [Bacillota bacterium]
MFFHFFIETDDPEEAKEIAYNKLSIINASNIILDKNKKYWKIESLYEVEIFINEKIKSANFQKFLDDIAYDWNHFDDSRNLLASKKSIKESNEKIYFVSILKELDEIE